MSAQILPFRDAIAPSRSIAHFIRIDDTGHRKLADLHAAGRLPARRVVVDASRLHYQKELIEAFKLSGAEIVLDTKAAELATPAKAGGFVKRAPWAASGNGGLLGPEYFTPGASSDVIGQIARFAVRHGVRTVLAPGHFLGNVANSEWFIVDRLACQMLRDALDREGGRNIAIDYPLILSHVALNNDDVRHEIVDGLSDLPFDNLWIRASGFGADAFPATTKRYITALTALHNLGKTIIADYLGGLVGLAALAFGCVSGIAHGIGERERFDARSWHKMPLPESKGNRRGSPRRILISGLDRTATIAELEILAKAKSGHRLVVCGDRDCCRGLSDMIENPRAHAAYQRFEQIRDLEKTPDLNREQHFLNGQLAQADRLAREVKGLSIPLQEAEARNVNATALKKRLIASSERLEKLRFTLEHLHEARADGSPRAREAVHRTPVLEERGSSRL